MLSHTVHVNIAPMTAVDASFTPSRRPSLVGDVHNPRRVMSDSILPQPAPPRYVFEGSARIEHALICTPESCAHSPRSPRHLLSRPIRRSCRC